MDSHLTPNFITRRPSSSPFSRLTTHTFPFLHRPTHPTTHADDEESLLFPPESKNYATTTTPRPSAPHPPLLTLKSLLHLLFQQPETYLLLSSTLRLLILVTINAALARLAYLPRDEVMVGRLVALGRHTFVFGVGETVGGCAVGVWGCGEGEGVQEDVEGVGEKGVEDGEDISEDKREEEEEIRGMWAIVAVVGVLAVGWVGTAFGGVMVWWG